MNTKRLLSVATMLIITASLLLAACAPTAQVAENKQVEKLLGSWNADITTLNQGTFPALMTFTSDGSVIAAESPIQFESSGHGNWNNKTSGDVAYTFTALYGSEEGKNTGKLKVVGTLNMDSGKDSWSGPFKIDVFDASGQVIFTDNGTVNLTRIAVETIQQTE
jgi:hypothetical protein